MTVPPGDSVAERVRAEFEVWQDTARAVSEHLALVLPIVKPTLEAAVATPAAAAQTASVAAITTNGRLRITLDARRCAA